MTDEVKKADQAREVRLRDAQKEPVKHKPKEIEFEKMLENKMLTRPSLLSQNQSKTVTEDAIREAVRHDDQRHEEQKKDDDKEESRDDKDFGSRTLRKHEGGMQQKVIAKGRLKQDSGDRQGGGRQGGGFGSQTQRRDVSKLLNKSHLKSVPIDLQSKFASRLSQALKNASSSQHIVMSQQVLNKIIQYVKIGLNRKGEKEIQMELSQHILKGMRLKVTSRDKKVAIHFKARDEKGRKAIEANKEAILAALKNKGLDVDEFIIS